MEMEGVRRFWKRRGYRRLRGSRRYRRPRAAGPSRRMRLSWPRLDFLKKARSISPKKWLVRLRDSYVNMMLRLAGSQAFTTGTIGDAGISAFGREPLKEYDHRAIVELYRAILLAESSQRKAAGAPIVHALSRVPGGDSTLNVSEIS